MRAEPLRTHSVAFMETVVIVGAIYVLSLFAFVKLWGLITEDQLLAPLTVLMVAEFGAACLLDNKLGILTFKRIWAALTIKALLGLSVLVGFVIQRASMVLDRDADTPWADWVIGSVMAYELFRFVRTLAAFEIRLGPITAAAEWLNRQFAPPADEYRKRREINRAVRYERQAAQEEYYDTGKPGSQPALDVLSGDDIPESDCDLEAPPDGRTPA